jgi:hypothetical protein
VRNVGIMFHGNLTAPMVAAVANNSSLPSFVARGIGRTHLRMAVGRGTIGMTAAICLASSSIIAYLLAAPTGLLPNI